MITLRPLALSLLILLLSVNHSTLFAQNKITFSGYVEGETSGERLILVNRHGQRHYLAFKHLQISHYKTNV